MEGWHDGPSQDKGARWEVAEVGPALTALVERASPVSVFQSRPREGEEGQLTSGGPSDN